MKAPIVNPYESPAEPSSEQPDIESRVPGPVLVTSVLIYCACGLLIASSLIDVLGGVEIWEIVRVVVSVLIVVLQFRASVLRDRPSSYLIGGAIVVAAVMMLVPFATGYAPSRFLFNSFGVAFALVILPLGVVMLWWARKIGMMQSDSGRDKMV